MHELIAKFDNKPWAALMDGRRWVLSTPECQTRLAEAIKVNISRGLTRSAYVLDTGMVRRAQLERTHPSKHRDAESANYERDYFQKYFEALNWLHKEGSPPFSRLNKYSNRSRNTHGDTRQHAFSFTCKYQHEPSTVNLSKSDSTHCSLRQPLKC